MRTLLIDNYDSFTFNLYQYLAAVNRVPPIVVRNDTAPWDEIRNLDFDNIVISPGPGLELRLSDFAESQGASPLKLRVIQSHVTPTQSSPAASR